MRLLLDPTAETNGTVTEETKVTEVAKVAEPPKVDPNKVTIPRSDLDAMKARIQQIDDAEREAETKVREANEQKLRDKGEFDKLDAERKKDIASRDQTIASKDQKIRDIELKAGKALAEAKIMASLPAGLVEGAADDLVQLILPHMESKLDGENFVVNARDGRSVAEFIKDYMAKKQHFLTATSRGGAGSGGGDSTATRMDDTKKTKTLGEIMVDRVKANAPKSGSVAFGGKYLGN